MPPPRSAHRPSPSPGQPAVPLAVHPTRESTRRPSYPSSCSRSRSHRSVSRSVPRQEPVPPMPPTRLPCHRPSSNPRPSCDARHHRQQREPASTISRSNLLLGQCKVKRRSTPNFRFDPDPPAMTLDHLLGRAQPHSQPVCRDLTKPCKEPKDLLVLLRRNSNTVVPHCDFPFDALSLATNFNLW